MQNLRIALLILVAGGLLGCGPALYNINVNGYTDQAAPALISPGGTFFVIENQQAQNPLLEKEIAGKINRLLDRQGYRLSAYEQAKYYLFFSYGIGTERAANVAMPDYSYGFGIGGGAGPGYGWRGGNYFFAAPFFTLYPSPDPLFNRWLLINVVDGQYYREKGEFRTLWVGEARSTGTSQDLRVAIDYLLLADFQQFGKNTGKALSVELKPDAPQLQGLNK